MTRPQVAIENPILKQAVRGGSASFPLRRRGHHRRRARRPTAVVLLHAHPQGQARGWTAPVLRCLWRMLIERGQQIAGLDAVVVRGLMRSMHSTALSAGRIREKLVLSESAVVILIAQLQSDGFIERCSDSATSWRTADEEHTVDLLDCHGSRQRPGEGPHRKADSSGQGREAPIGVPRPRSRVQRRPR